MWLPDRLAPDFSRVSPLSGLKRIFSLIGTARLGFGLVKVLHRQPSWPSPWCGCAGTK